MTPALPAAIVPAVETAGTLLASIADELASLTVLVVDSPALLSACFIKLAS